MSHLEASKHTNKSGIKNFNELKEMELAKINTKRTYIEPGKTCLLNQDFFLIGKTTLLPTMWKKEKIKSKFLKKYFNGWVWLL